ncbi:response regulator transcription factor [Paenibacillus pabuli]|uniref:response regulator transcription factor n=1 Tax=Paenibacillus pabuli TaxID=1472 RepID=UPI001FFF8A77|nr:helix-turn-helix domain-containing protein [Paenibacillus pabuli]UPK41398.1 helix-turn-helix domain-containing protein [Paenibacillus pabuli]
MMDVLLVDDEPWILEGLRSMINWDKYGYRICGEAENGNDAWVLIKNLQPDLVFTDIHMPSVNGLELINRSNGGLARPPRFVILSGYDSFEYAKLALNLRVEDYLLKPIDEVEIESLLESITPKILEDNVAAEARQREHAIYVNGLFNRLLQGKDSSQLRAEARRMLRMEVHEDMACLLVATDICKDNVKGRINSFADAHWSEPFVDAEGNIGVFAADKKGSPKQLEEMGRSLFEIYSGHASITVAFGRHSGAGCVMRSAYENALLALKWKRYHNEVGFVHQQDLPQNDPLASVNQKALANLMEAILTDEQDKLERKIDTLLANPDSGLPASDIEYVRVQLLALEMSILKQLNELKGDIGRFMLHVQNMAGIITKIDTFPAFQEYALMLSLNALKTIQEQRKEKAGNTVFHVIQYVNQEFREKLKLQELAQKFHMNANYLGQAFKQQTGKTFREYLNDKRNEEAKKLLRQSCLTIPDVAVQSGYPNSDYFVTQFKRMTGMAPSAYRKQ